MQFTTPMHRYANIAPTWDTLENYKELENKACLHCVYFFPSLLSRAHRLSAKEYEHELAILTTTYNSTLYESFVARKLFFLFLYMS